MDRAMAWLNAADVSEPGPGQAAGAGRLGGTGALAARDGRAVEEGRDPPAGRWPDRGVVGQFELELLGHREQVGRVDLAPRSGDLSPCAAAKASISVPSSPGCR
jgi:hypothetical protein